MLQTCNDAPIHFPSQQFWL